MRTSVNMSLKIWDDLDDPYDHNELAANWQAVDEHNHTPGRGVQIPTAGIEDNAITNAKVAPDAITTAEILNYTILAEDLADGIIGINHFSNAVFETLAPLGMVVPWFRPTTSVPLPPGWVIANGQTVAPANHSWGGGGSVTVPDLRNRFVLGAATDGVDNTSLPNSAPSEATSSSIRYGGANVKALNHSHTVPGHTHSVSAHSHTVGAHNHGIISDGNHSHGMRSRMNGWEQGGHNFRDILGTIYSNNLQSLYVGGFNQGQYDDAVPVSGAHAHSGATGLSSPFATDVATATTSSTPVTTDGVNQAQDIRPNYVGLLYIIKVKYY
jgi:hypothetical protein